MKNEKGREKNSWKERKKRWIKSAAFKRKKKRSKLEDNLTKLNKVFSFW